MIKTVEQMVAAWDVLSKYNFIKFKVDEFEG